MKIKRLSPWYGANGANAAAPGKLLAGCEWIGVVFAGSMAEIPYFLSARTIVVNDLHRAMINLARVVADPDLKVQLIDQLNAVLFHPDELAGCQDRCRSWEAGLIVRAASDMSAGALEAGASEELLPAPIPNLYWAVDYFVCAWMSRNGEAGKDREFDASLALRWEAGGGDSAVRFRNATASLEEWHKVMRRCTFSTLDAFEFLKKCKDRKGHGIYVDAPWPDDGDGYKHKFTEWHQEQLAAWLLNFFEARVVIRFGDHHLIRKLYPESDWTWIRQSGRTQTNAAKAEVLLVNKGASL